MSALGSWWDGVELWSTGLTFPLQAALVLAVLLPLAALAAWGLDLLAAAVGSVRQGSVRQGSVRPGSLRRGSARGGDGEDG